MSQILIGKQAHEFCKRLLKEDCEDFYKNKKEGNQKRGYYPEKIKDSDKVVFVAFDNRTNDCWVEQFDTPELAVSWLNDEFEFEDLSVFKRNRK